MKVFENGRNNQQPVSKAEQVRPGDGLTPEELYAKGSERWKARDFSGALMWYEKAAEQGEARAQYHCGNMYSNGEGIKKDKTKALMWYEKAAEQGVADAQFYCGVMYDKGEGTKADKAKALMWYEEAAEQGNIIAQNRCGDMYYVGEGTKADKAKALMWYEKVAEDDVLAQINFVDMYCVGDVVYAQNRCGEMYSKGEGTKADKVKALTWYEEAAERGDVRAQVCCGDMYYSGEGTEADWEKALMWYEKAAEQGNVQAQFHCGEMYDKGEGTKADKVKALMWHEKAEQEIQKYKMTQSRYDELKKELDYCRTARSEELQKHTEAFCLEDKVYREAREKESREAASRLYGRIEEIEKILQQAIIVEL